MSRLPYLSAILALSLSASVALVSPSSSLAQDGAPDSSTQTTTHDRLNVLLLDYHAPIEHDVLLSHLCVEPCTRTRKCPDELIRRGVDYWNDDFAVYRPQYLGRNARFVVDVYKNRDIDFLSISGHHASGFSGDYGRGSFNTEKLTSQLRGLPGRDGFFVSPMVVLLQGCWTDVKSGFDGDPIEYVRHIIEDTTVRAGESSRLLAAVQQIAGNEEAYRDLFPNACILGYQGTQVPGGLLEIYGQVNGFLRGLANDGADAESLPEIAPKFSVIEARKSNEAMDAMVKQVDQECSPVGWPCNLCSADSDYYSPLRDALVSFLGDEKKRNETGRQRSPQGAQGLERNLEDSSLYSNSSWSCSAEPPGTLPIFPEPLDRGPYLEMFVDLLMVDFGEIDGEVRFRIESELIHMLGSVEAPEDARERLLQRMESEAGRQWRQEIVAQTLPRLSTFRQRSFYEFLGEIGCVSCFEGLFQSSIPRATRENAAAALQPRLGRTLYEKALSDPSPRVRRLATSRIDLSLGEDLFVRMSRDENTKVQETAQKFWRQALDAAAEEDEAPTVDEEEESGSDD